MGEVWQGIEIHYHADDFTLSSDKRNEWQTSCLEKSHYCCTDVARSTFQLDYEDKTAPTKVSISRNAFEFAKKFVESMLPFTFKMWDFLNSADEKHVVSKDVFDQLPGKFKYSDVWELKPVTTAKRYIKTWEASNLILKTARAEYKNYK